MALSENKKKIGWISTGNKNIQKDTATRFKKTYPPATLNNKRTEGIFSSHSFKFSYLTHNYFTIYFVSLNG